MTAAYINYSYPHITVHTEAACSHIPAGAHSHNRVIELDRHNLAKEMRRFAEHAHHFTPDSREDDLWLLITLDTEDQELGVVHAIQALLGLHYDVLRKAAIKVHC